MNERETTRPAPHMQTRQGAIVAVVAASIVLGGLIAFAQGGTKKTDASSRTTAATTPVSESVGATGSVAVSDPNAVTTTTAAGAAADPAAASVDPAAAADAATEGQDLDGSDLTSAETCVLTVQSVRAGASGTAVSCLQTALTNAGFYSGAVTGTFDAATDAAVRKLQTDRNLFVDGVVGRESAISLGIWPDEATLVVHTPKPAPGTVDSRGFALSTVSSIGADIPPLPENSGSGKRVVYDRAGQRVWAVDGDGTVIRSWLVSGSKYSNETPGTHQVYSKSEVSTAWNGKAYLPLMIRYLKTDIGNIGFHGIPTHVNDGSAYQTEAELGTRLSGGCQRQANNDAKFLWAFADIGTTVVVI
jgi:peptidoglycan hydrolase-like protein with peptidoglycan-binding domain